MGNRQVRAGAKAEAETQSLSESTPAKSTKDRKPAKRTLSFGDKPRSRWTKKKDDSEPRAHLYVE